MMKAAYIFLTTIISVFAVPFDFDYESEIKCGYDACNPIKEGYLNVHLVPHTHDDVGWLKTVDQYYFGSKQSVQSAGVQYILDSVIDALQKDSSRKFIYVETAYFWKWWKRQHDSIRHRVKTLVNNGQLQFAGGAWSMNDEACTHYQSTIDQFTWGLRKLNETFGKCGHPKVGWQIDPFGHSREMASLFAQMGYDGLFFARLDYQDRVKRKISGSMEMLWNGSPDNLGNSSQLFTSVLFDHYGPPAGFCFDIVCTDEPIIDDKKSPDYNVDRRVADFLYFIKHQARYYRTNNIIMTMGGDFTYADANIWFTNLDRLMSYSNNLQLEGSKINLLYSNPACYLKAVNTEGKNIKWPVKNDDFFPYSSDPHAFWTGYFTSRPTLKRFERVGNNILQVCKQLYTLASLGPEDWADLNKMREAMGIMQHHDAVTGTEKQNVAFDYARILSEGIEECEFASSTALSKLIKAKSPLTDFPKLKFESCPLLNISQCSISENSKNFVVTIYNPLSHNVSKYIRLPVTGKAYEVKDTEGNNLQVQLIPLPDSLLSIPGRRSLAVNDLIFKAENLPPLGFTSYYIQENGNSDMTTKENLSEDRYVLKLGNVKIELDPDTNLLKEVTVNGIPIQTKQDFSYYESHSGDNVAYENRSSGAYVFRPLGDSPINVSGSVKTKTYTGYHVFEVHQIFNKWISQVVRLYRGENHLELEWLVGPIPVNDKIGKEVITRFNTGFNTNGTFYTDSNGRETLKRVRNFRPTWRVTLEELVSGNYYPITSKIAVQDEQKAYRFAVLNDRSQGGSSLNDGEIEIMLHRRILHDDAFGVSEALNETAYGEGLVARGQLYLIFGNRVAYERQLALEKLLQPQIFFALSKSLSYESFKDLFSKPFSGLKNSLPPNVHILTLEPWSASTVLLRLEHIMEKNEDVNLSKPVTVNIQNIFTPFQITSIRETTLGANEWLSESKRLKWQAGDSLNNGGETSSQSEDASVSDRNDSTPDENMYDYLPGLKWWKQHLEHNEESYDNHVEYAETHNFSVTLNPMQIRTFVIKVDSYK